MVQRDTALTVILRNILHTIINAPHTKNMCIYILGRSRHHLDTIRSKWNTLEDARDIVVGSTRFNRTHFVNLNSELVSTLLDDPRDTSNILIGVVMMVSIVSILLLMHTPALAKSSFVLLVLSCVMFGTYVLHVFGLIVAPICFSFPLDMRTGADYDYFAIVSHSLVYVVGDYDPIAWVIGVVVHGIWVWSVMLLLLFLVRLYGVVLCIACCDEDRADKLGLVVVIPWSQSQSHSMSIAIETKSILYKHCTFACACINLDFGAAGWLRHESINTQKVKAFDRSSCRRWMQMELKGGIMTLYIVELLLKWLNVNSKALRGDIMSEYEDALTLDLLI
eukprot:369268_1